MLQNCLLLAILHTSWGNALFGTAPLGQDVWLLGAGLAVVFALLEEGRKWLLRRAVIS